jgi:hypothetical protein
MKLHSGTPSGTGVSGLETVNFYPHSEAGEGYRIGILNGSTEIFRMRSNDELLCALLRKIQAKDW